MKLENHLHIFAKSSHTKFHENPSNLGIELFHAEWWTERQTDMTKLIIAFRNFTNAPNTVLLNWTKWGGDSEIFWVHPRTFFFCYYTKLEFLL